MKSNCPQASRRKFLKTAMALPATLAAAPAMMARAAENGAAGSPGTSVAALPRRQLGKNGPQVTMLCMGGMMTCLSPQYLDIAWSMGIRYFDTADCYVNKKSETFIAQWLQKYPERRKEIFLVSKDHPHDGPEQLLQMIDKRLAACGTDYLDAFYIHGIGAHEYGDESLNWPKSDAFKKVAEKLKSSGKVKMVGFSCHDGQLNDYLSAAAEGGFVDIIMMKYTAFFAPGDPFDKALQACHDKGIALVAMKTMRNLSSVPKRVPEFDKLGLTTRQAVLHAVWSDPRISVICSMINNVNEMDENSKAALAYKKPLKTAHVQLLKETILASRQTFCPGCPSCAAFAASAGSTLHDIARYVTYYEQDGDLGARDLYQSLPPRARDLGGIDLAALRDACSFRVDYPDIARRAERYFA
jgi:uncharacterized protein